MKELKLYSISDEYIEWLRRDFPNVYSNKMESRNHTRKYLGVVIKIDNYSYYIPLSSPKNTDFQITGDKKVIKKSIIPIIRIVTKNSLGEKELKGTLRISHMIPVPESELTLYDVDHEIDEKYKDLIINEMIYIRKNQEKIITYANTIYKQKQINEETAGYIKHVLDFKKLEEKCEEYKMYMSNYVGI